MNVLILTSIDYVDWINNFCVDYMTEHLIFNIYGKHDFDKFRKSYSYDVGISFMYTDKIPKKEIDRSPWINFHPGPLPMYKGRNLCYHAILNGEKEFGATVHYMDEDFDTGDIIDIATFPMHDWETAETLSDAAINMCKKLFIEYFPRIVTGEKFERIPNIDGRYYKKRPINDTIELDEYITRWIRAVTYKQFYPKINIHGIIYKIVRDE